ncbi:MAG: hypothetical protein AAF289_01600 [Cyanobacteria bacterium P01_A01_bin.135]
MFGEFQQSRLRIELDASEAAIRDSLISLERLKQWQWPQQFIAPVPTQLEVGTVFTTQLGPIATEHRVEAVSDTHLRLLLSRSVDGFHDWDWGDGWVQSCLEGVSLLPLGAGNSLALAQLRRFLQTQS